MDLQTPTNSTSSASAHINASSPTGRVDLVLGCHSKRRASTRAARAGSKRRAADLKVLAMLAGKPWGLTVHVIALRTGLNRWTLYDVLARLEAAGCVVRSDRRWGSRYALTPAAPSSPAPFVTPRRQPAREFLDFVR